MVVNRKEIEQLIYDTYDALDPSGTNSAKYRALFSTMDDKKFEKFFKDFLKHLLYIPGSVFFVNFFKTGCSIGFFVCHVIFAVYNDKNKRLLLLQVVKAFGQRVCTELLRAAHKKSGCFRIIIF